MIQNLFRLSQEAIGRLTKKRQIGNKLPLRGRFVIEHWRKGVLLKTYDFPNDITNEGKNTIFDTYFNNTTQITTWYIGIVNASGFSAFNATDVMTSHAGWVEFTGYSQANRVTWTSGAASGQSVTNSSPAVFDMTGTATLHGVFITSNNVKSGTSGKLWATAPFNADINVVNGDELKVTYTISA